MDDEGIMELTLPRPAIAEVSVPVSAMRAECLQDWAAIASLEPEWNRLLGESAADSIFLTWEWIRCWADVMGAQIRPLVVAVRDERGELVGIAPMYQAKLRLAHTIQYRVLRVMADFPTGADYSDWIVRRGCEDAATAAIVRALATFRSWDFIWMPRMAGWTGSFDRIVSACRASGLPCRTRTHDFAAFPLPADRDVYFRSLSRNKRQALNSETKRIMNRPTVEIVRCETEDQLPAFLNALFDLHGRRWTEKGGTGTFKNRPLEIDFYRAFAPIALKRGWLCLIALREEGEFKAIQVGYVYRNVFYQLQEGFDPGYVPGAGNVLRAKVIEDCIRQGLEAYDFLGDMSEHKRRWQATLREGHDLFIGRSTLKNLLLTKPGVWPSGRYLLQVSPAAGIE
jgi:CelD/BcsL family acetyltransferase involved in cellulose biosynthesis